MMRIATIAALSVFLVFAPDSVAARSDNDPPPLRNGGHQFTLLRPLRPAPLTPLLGADGRIIDLGHFRGQVVLLNFWATWCPPCVYEMPSLDRLQSDMKKDGLQVVAVSIDRDGLRTVAPFFERLGLADLDIFLDPELRTAYFETGTAERAAFALYGLPITYIIDHKGVVMGYIRGAVAWDSKEARRFLHYYLARAQREGRR